MAWFFLQHLMWCSFSCSFLHFISFGGTTTHLDYWCSFLKGYCIIRFIVYLNNHSNNVSRIEMSFLTCRSACVAFAYDVSCCSWAFSVQHFLQEPLSIKSNIPLARMPYFPLLLPDWEECQAICVYPFGMFCSWISVHYFSFKLSFWDLFLLHGLFSI